MSGTMALGFSLALAVWAYLILRSGAQWLRGRVDVRGTGSGRRALSARSGVAAAGDKAAKGGTDDG